MEELQLKGIKLAKLGIVITIIVAVIGTYLSYYLNQSVLVNSNSHSNLLKAESEYIQGNYASAIRIYNSLNEESVALNNLGYIYSKGYGVDRNVIRAKDYYMLAILKGNDLSYSNYIKLCLSEPIALKDLIDILDTGIKMNNSISLLMVNELLRNTSVIDKYGHLNFNEYLNSDFEDKKDMIIAMVNKNYLNSEAIINSEVDIDDAIRLIDRGLRKVLVGYENRIITTSEIPYISENVQDPIFGYVAIDYGVIFSIDEKLDEEKFIYLDASSIY